MKNYFMKRIPLLCMVLMLISCMVLSGCASRTTPTADDFTIACKDAGYTPEDVASQFDPTVLDTALVYADSDTALGYYSFLDAASAKSNYAQLLSEVKTGSSNEKHIDSSEYNRFYGSDDSSVILLYRNGTTFIYISGTSAEALNDLIDTLGI